MEIIYYTMIVTSVVSLFVQISRMTKKYLLSKMFNDGSIDEKTYLKYLN